MKKLLALLVLVSAFTIAGSPAQMVWNYDFGTSTGTYTSNAISTNFLPAAATNGGTAMVRIGSAGGSFTMTNVSGFGSGSALVGLASTSTSVNKFSIYNYSSPSNTFSLSFDMRLSGGSTGSWSFFAGNGSTFTNSNPFISTDTFAGLQMAFGASDAIAVSTRANTNWAAISGTGIGQNTNYTISIFGNNSAEAKEYVIDGNTNALAANTWDLWVGSTKVGSNLEKSLLGDGNTVDSFMFTGISSTANTSTLTVDNFTYANYLYVVPEPSTYAMLALAAAGLAGHMVRRRRR